MNEGREEDMTEKLLPCPFCGQPPETEESGVGGTGLMIFCISDNCPNPHTSYYSHNSARRVWNRRASGWQPIETAPKNGRQIDLWSPGRGRITDCVWGEAISGPHEGNRVWLCNGLDRRILSPSDATHWMLKPPAPQGEG